MLDAKETNAGVCECPQAAVTKGYKLGSSKQRKAVHGLEARRPNSRRGQDPPSHVQPPWLAPHHSVSAL